MLLTALVVMVARRAYWALVSTVQTMHVHRSSNESDNAKVPVSFRKQPPRRVPALLRYACMPLTSYESEVYQGHMHASVDARRVLICRLLWAAYVKFHFCSLALVC